MGHEEIIKLKEKSFEDERGRFIKFFDEVLLSEHSFSMCQQNYVQTKSKYVLRGLHYQVNEAAEAKIFRVIEGSIQLCAVDIRPESTTYLKTTLAILKPLRDAYLIPRGFATGYLTLEPNTTVLYMSDNHYAPNQEKGIRPNDPRLAIAWQSEHYSLSEKDKNWPYLK
ncbi:MAG: dTDP-4-dehydrorhamnose 3,5-epimerase family protein [Reichenbachiella sp.]